MGNFSVNHYARLEPDAHGVAIRYVMDLAEIPTFEMFQQWGPRCRSPEEGDGAGARVGGQPGDHGERQARAGSRAARAGRAGGGRGQHAGGAHHGGPAGGRRRGRVHLRRSQLPGTERVEGDRRSGRQGSQRRIDGLSAGSDGGASTGAEDRIFVDRAGRAAVRPVVTQSRRDRPAPATSAPSTVSRDRARCAGCAPGRW